MEQQEPKEPQAAPGETETVEVLNIAASDATRTGVYADVASVSHDPDGVTIDFLFSEPTDRTHGVLQARVHMSHRMTLRLFQALRNNIRSWAPNELGLRERERELLQSLAGTEDPE